MFRRISDLIVVFIASIGAISILFVANNSIVREILTLPLALVLPGYAITAATFPRSRLGFPIRFVFSLGLNVAVIALGSLILNWTAWGLQSASWLMLLLSVTVGACIIAAVRRRSDTTVLALPTNVGISFRQGVFFSLAALIVAAAIGIAHLPTSSEGIEGYTLLWLLPTNKANQNDFHLGIRSMELTNVRYRLLLYEGEKKIHEWPSIQMNPGETWESTEVLSEKDKESSVRALLFRLDGPQWPPYRSVELKRESEER